MLNYPCVSSPWGPWSVLSLLRAARLALLFFVSLRLFFPAIPLKSPHYPISRPACTSVWILSKKQTPCFFCVYCLDTSQDLNPQSGRKAVTLCALENSFPEAVRKGALPLSPYGWWVLNYFPSVVNHDPYRQPTVKKRNIVFQSTQTVFFFFFPFCCIAWNHPASLLNTS